MLGVAEPLTWRIHGDSLVVELPARLQDEAHRPREQCYVLKIETSVAIHPL